MKNKLNPSELAVAKSYDRTPYAGNPYYYTHPGVLAAYGALSGLSPSDPAQCRVLELGCGDGNNIIPMAYEFPKSCFLGIDLSPVQIGIGLKSIGSLNLKNIQLLTRSIMDMREADGRFDYIIVHGVYSWVPPEVRKKILDICRSNLSEQGIAYISYNVLPGWRFNQTMRDMFLYRTRHMKAPGQKVQAAIDLCNTMLKGTADGKSVHDMQLRFFGKTLRDFPNVSSHLLHEYMETHNTSFYFHQFAGDLKNHGLQYICDANQPDFELDSLPPDTAAAFEEISENAVEVEQYIDFLKNTRFRRSLICRKELDLNSNYRLDRIQHLYAATDVVPVLDSPDIPIEEAAAFKTSSGRKFSATDASARIVLHRLSKIKPCTISVDSLIKTILQQDYPRTGQDFQKQAEKMGHVVYTLFFNGVLELLGAERQCIPEAGNFPAASRISRFQAPSRRVTNLCHRTILMDDDMACFVLARLDGTLDRNSLCDLMTEAVQTGRIHIPKLDTRHGGTIRESMQLQLASILEQLPRCGVLINPDRHITFPSKLPEDQQK
jgi:methyltransferase-like protein/2-polyprenyl-3-methyl-5-hydroxy-6-metoxy-1,4-benzoquinol methylase